VDCLLTLDAGTGSGRCIAFDLAGRSLAWAQAPFTYRVFSDPAMPFLRGFDLDPKGFWDVLSRCSRTVLGQLPADARIRGVIATSQREGCVLLDRAGEVLYAGPNLDARSVAEGMELQEKMSVERLHAITGHAPPYIFPVARYLWFRKHGDARRVAVLLMLNDWITYLLSGRQVAEHSNAGESMLYDVSRRAWSAEILDTLDIPRGILPELCQAGAPAGAVTAAAAAATGIPEGTAVFAGGADTESGLLGSGVHQDGQTGAVIGTTTPVQMVTDRPILDAGATLWTSCHVVPDRWVLESNAGDTGDGYRWLLELMFGGTDADAHAAAERAMETADTGARRVFCHLGPLIFNLGDMSPFKPAGLFFRYPLLHVDRPARGEILRAYVESVAFAIRGNCERIRAVSGKPIPLLVVSGGMTQSPTLVRTLANVMGVPVAVATVPESASLGSAILAAVGAGMCGSVGEGVQTMTRSLQVDPEPVRGDEYEERYGKWREMHDALRTWTL
jgi:sugar (pentulose or hexulose) kinase